MQHTQDFIQFELFKTHRSIQHGVSNRNSGVSNGNYRSLNLSFNCGDNHKSVQLNREKIAFAFGVEKSNLLFPNQCHTSNVVCVHSPEVETTNTDALITDKKGIAIGVLTADCVPILFFDKKKNVIAAAHSGWRGTVKKISGKVLQKMNSNYSSLPEDIIVGIGPCIQHSNYEVGPEVLLELKKLGLGELLWKYVLPSLKAGHANIDLQGINKQLLLEAGVPETNIEVMNLCTYSNPDMFFSARRDGFQTGRFGSVILLK